MKGPSIYKFLTSFPVIIVLIVIVTVPIVLIGIVAFIGDI